MPLTPLNASDRRCHGAPGLPGITDGTRKSRFLLVSALWKSIFCNLCTSVQSNFFEMLLASVAAPRLAAPTASPFPSLLRGPPWWRRVWCFGGTSLCSCCLWLLCTPIIPVFQICTVKIIKSSSHQWKPTALSVYLSLSLSWDCFPFDWLKSIQTPRRFRFDLERSWYLGSERGSTHKLDPRSRNRHLFYSHDLYWNARATIVRFHPNCCGTSIVPDSEADLQKEKTSLILRVFLPITWTSRTCWPLFFCHRPMVTGFAMCHVHQSATPWDSSVKSPQNLLKDQRVCGGIVKKMWFSFPDIKYASMKNSYTFCCQTYSKTQVS